MKSTHWYCFTTFIFNKTNYIWKKHDGSMTRTGLSKSYGKVQKVDNLIVDNLVKEGKIKFYVRYVDDTLLLVKQWDIDKVLKAFNGFD